MEALQADLMMKHLSSTRHKTLIDAFREEELFCEECHNSNIHQLQIIRFGGEDMSLLCNSCFNKEYTDSERPTTAYSLSNGSILKYWDSYLKVRDCSCQDCGSERNLNVNNRKLVLCDTCLKKKSISEAKSFVSENSGRFLYLYLGIKESSNSNSVKRKGGRKVGRGKRGRIPGKDKNSREKKPLTVHEQMAKKAYETKKQNSAIVSDNTLSLRSFKGQKAATTSSTHTMTKSSEKFANPRLSKTPSKSNEGKSHASKRAPTAFAKNKINTKQDHGLKDRSHGPSRASVKTKSHHFAERAGESISHRGKKAESSNTERFKANNNNLSKKSSQNLAEKRSGEKNKMSREERKASPKGKDGIRPLSRKQNPKMSSLKDTVKKSENSGLENKSTDKAKLKHKKNENTIIEKENDGEEVEEGEFLRKFTKYVPKMSYPDIESYFNEFSNALFLEQKLENDFLQDFQIVWPKNKGETVFVVSMRSKNNPELENLLPPNLAKLGRLPFTNRQPLILATKDESQVWYTYVKEAAAKRDSITLLLELYSWNRIKLPIKSANDQFKMLPCSAQANRIFFAMTRVKNPKFIDLVLGQKPIKQINFQNRLKFTKDTLNASQKSAIQHVLNNSVTILQGPPGTGKTSTIEEIILQMIENFHSFPILCVAASNIAIDNIAEKFMLNKPEMKILRIVSEGKEQQYNKEHPLGKICLHNIVQEQLPTDMKETIGKLRAHRSNEVSKNQYSKLLTEQNNIADRHVLQAQILFTTNIAAGGRQLKAIQELPVVIMDESTQSSEASTLVPLSLPGIRTFVFVGDEKQLSSFSNIPQLEMSLFERVLLNGCYTKPHMLDTQYRMHPNISEFPILKFYNGQLKDGVTSEEKSWPDINYPLFFYQCNHGAETKVMNRQRGMRGFTYNNHYESAEILKVLYKLILDKNVKHDQIGIITPYSAQRDLLSETLVNDPVVNPKGIAMEQEVDEADLLDAGIGRSNGAKKNTINIINGVYVATIDSFQGHEKNFIIFSCVRNNKENKIGFVSDRRRLNVALTRAKNGLILVGNNEVLKNSDTLWKDYIQYLEDKGVIFNNLNVY